MILKNIHVMSKGEILNWLSIMLLSCLHIIHSGSFILILFCWTLIIIITGNAKRVAFSKSVVFGVILRRSLYVFPLLFPFLVFFDRDFFEAFNFNSWLILGGLLGITSILPKINEWKIFLSKDFISLTRKKEKFDYLTMIYVLVGGAITEELFFRLFIVSIAMNELSYFFAAILSAFFFFLYHFSAKWSSKFSLYDFSLQFTFGFLSSMLFIFSGSILPSIVAHIIYNSPHILLNLKSLMQFHYENVIQGDTNEKCN
jgi:membrane protease YdiL (CAAX protease family)